MLIASRKLPEPEWVTVLGAEFLFAPIDRSMVIRARRAARSASKADDAAAPAEAIDMLEEMGHAMSRALILDGMRDWRDVCVQAVDDDGEPLVDDAGDPVFDLLDFSAVALDLLLADPMTFEAIDAAYVVPFVLRERERAAPGNGSAALPSGTGEAAMPAPDSVISPAMPALGAAAGNAPTSSKSRSRKRKRMSGAS